ncbi:hypothetical protein SAMN04490196_0839 [Pseudomonas moraviensis]|nr:hypothetical protein SAMN04490196_0839 [Pseudomonas moraviensis]
MNANKTRRRYGRWILLALIALPIAVWYFASPVVAVNISPNSEEEFHYVWNTQDRIHKDNALAKLTHSGHELAVSSHDTLGRPHRSS